MSFEEATEKQVGMRVELRIEACNTKGELYKLDVEKIIWN